MHLGGRQRRGAAPASLPCQPTRQAGWRAGSSSGSRREGWRGGRTWRRCLFRCVRPRKVWPSRKRVAPLTRAARRLSSSSAERAGGGALRRAHLLPAGLAAAGAAGSGVRPRRGPAAAAGLSARPPPGLSTLAAGFLKAML
jgi:hypothetical protein